MFSNFRNSREAIAAIEIKEEDEETGLLYENLEYKDIAFSDKFSGLGIILNGIWAYEVYIKKIQIVKEEDYPLYEKINIELDFIYYDHFGLDYPDIEKRRPPTIECGGHSLISWEHDIFYAWFVLQHFRGYIPFITRVSNSHNVSFLKQLR